MSEVWAGCPNLGHATKDNTVLSLHATLHYSFLKPYQDLAVRCALSQINLKKFCNKKIYKAIHNY